MFSLRLLRPSHTRLRCRRGPRSCQDKKLLSPLRLQLALNGLCCSSVADLSHRFLRTYSIPEPVIGGLIVAARTPCSMRGSPSTWLCKRRSIGVLLHHRSEPNAEAETLLREVFGGIDFFAAVVAAGSQISRTTARTGVGIPWHPAAERFFARASQASAMP